MKISGTNESSKSVFVFLSLLFSWVYTSATPSNTPRPVVLIALVYFLDLASVCKRSGVCFSTTDLKSLENQDISLVYNLIRRKVDFSRL